VVALGRRRRGGGGARALRHSHLDVTAANGDGQLRGQRQHRVGDQAVKVQRPAQQLQRTVAQQRLRLRHAVVQADEATRAGQREHAQGRRSGTRDARRRAAHQALRRQQHDGARRGAAGGGSRGQACDGRDGGGRKCRGGSQRREAVDAVAASGAERRSRVAIIVGRVGCERSRRRLERRAEQRGPRQREGAQAQADEAARLFPQREASQRRQCRHRAAGSAGLAGAPRRRAQHDAGSAAARRHRQHNLALAVRDDEEVPQRSAAGPGGGYHGVRHRTQCGAGAEQLRDAPTRHAIVAQRHRLNDDASERERRH